MIFYPKSPRPPKVKSWIRHCLNQLLKYKLKSVKMQLNARTPQPWCEPEYYIKLNVPS